MSLGVGGRCQLPLAQAAALGVMEKELSKHSRESGQLCEVDLKPGPGNMAGGSPELLLVTLSWDFLIHPDSQRKGAREKLICRKSSPGFKGKPRLQRHDLAAGKGSWGWRRCGGLSTATGP